MKKDNKEKLGKKKVITVLVIIGIVCLTLLGILYYSNRVPDHNEAFQPLRHSNVDNGVSNISDRYVEEFFEELIVTSDVTYSTKNGEVLKLDIYEAVNDTQQNKPAILLIHGGGFTAGDKANESIILSLAKDYAKRGYVSFVCNYRLGSEASKSTIYNAFEDVADAFNWISDEANQYNVDPNSIGVIGYSAGGIIAQNVFFTPETYAIEEESILGVAVIAGGNMYNSISENENNPACLLLHGTKDTTSSYRYSKKFYNQLVRKNVRANLYSFEGLSHNFTTRYDELRNQITAFFYGELSGEQINVNTVTEISPEYEKVIERTKNGPTYEVKQLEMTVDGRLEEWNGFEKIELKYIKDTDNPLPEENDFSGYAMVGWNERNPEMIYIAAEIVDDRIQSSNQASGKWYMDDCLEIAFDFSDRNIAEQLTKWGIGADGKSLSVLASKENTTVCISQSNDTYLYEIAIDVSKIDESILQNKKANVLEKGRTIGLSIAYNDGENGAREDQIGWTPGSANDRATFGNLVFK